MENNDKKNRFPRLNAAGEEVLDPRPVVAYMEIDPESGEVIQEGRPRPPSLEETLMRATNRGLFDDPYADEDDDDFYEEEDDGSLPVLSPHQEGFTDAYGLSEDKARKMLIKAGYAVVAPNQDLPPARTQPEPSGPTRKTRAKLNADESTISPDDSGDE